MIAKFLGEQIGTERWGEHTARQKAGLERRSDGKRVGVALADMGETLDDLKGEGAGFDMQALAGFLAKQAEHVGLGQHVGMDDLADDGGQTLERFAEFVIAAGAWFGRECFSRRWNVVSIGGFGFFCLVVEELHEQLVMAHLLALRAVDAFEEGGDDAFPDRKLRFKRGNLRGEFGNLLFGRFDGYLSSISHAKSVGKNGKYNIFHRSSYHGRWSPSRRSMPSASMARAVGLSISFRRSPSMSLGQLKVPRSSLFATTQ